MFNTHNLFIKISSIVILTCITTVNAVSISKKNYIHLNAGYSHLTRKLVSFNSKKHDGAFVGKIGVGYIINSYLRTDITARYSGIYKHKDTNGTEYEKFHIHNTALMLNGYFNLKSLWRNYIKRDEWFFPYVTAGIGYSINTTKDVHTQSVTSAEPRIVLGKKKGNIAWQFGAGSLFKISRNINIDCSYKFVNLGKSTTQKMYASIEREGYGPHPQFTGRLTTHEFSLGIIFKFH